MKVSAQTITRTIVSAIVLINTVMVMLGHNPLGVDESELYNVISGILAIGTTIDVWWKNNSFTKRALAGDKVKDAYKETE